MWTRSARNKETGMFTVTCTDWNGVTFFTGEYADFHEAEAAGVAAERRMTRIMNDSTAPLLDEATASMSDDELLAELLG